MSSPTNTKSDAYSIPIKYLDTEIILAKNNFRKERIHLFNNITTVIGKLTMIEKKTMINTINKAHKVAVAILQMEPAAIILANRITQSQQMSTHIHAIKNALWPLRISQVVN
jgi:predicted molibdopterin-dependent oxidoreductase YjgC